MCNAFKWMTGICCVKHHMRMNACILRPNWMFFCTYYISSTSHCAENLMGVGSCTWSVKSRHLIRIRSLVRSYLLESSFLRNSSLPVGLRPAVLFDAANQWLMVGWPEVCCLFSRVRYMMILFGFALLRLPKFFRESIECFLLRPFLRSGGSTVYLLKFY